MATAAMASLKPPRHLWRRRARTHSLTLSPDGKSIFFNSGNHTKLPENLDLSRPARAGDEDHILLACGMQTVTLGVSWHQGLRL